MIKLLRQIVVFLRKKLSGHYVTLGLPAEFLKANLLKQNEFSSILGASACTRCGPISKKRMTYTVLSQAMQLQEAHEAVECQCSLLVTL